MEIKIIIKKEYLNRIEKLASVHARAQMLFYFFDKG